MAPLVVEPGAQALRRREVPHDQRARQRAQVGLHGCGESARSAHEVDQDTQDVGLLQRQRGPHDGLQALAVPLHGLEGFQLRGESRGPAARGQLSPAGLVGSGAGPLERLERGRDALAARQDAAGELPAALGE